MKTERPYPGIHITPKAEKSLKRGHPWVYADEIRDIDILPQDGETVDVFAGNSWQGSGFYNSKSKIAVRVFSRNSSWLPVTCSGVTTYRLPCSLLVATPEFIMLLAMQAPMTSVPSRHRMVSTTLR